MSDEKRCAREDRTFFYMVMAAVGLHLFTPVVWALIAASPPQAVLRLDREVPTVTYVVLEEAAGTDLLENKPELSGEVSLSEPPIAAGAPVTAGVVRTEVARSKPERIEAWGNPSAMAPAAPAPSTSPFALMPAEAAAPAPAAFAPASTSPAPTLSGGDAIAPRLAPASTPSGVRDPGHATLSDPDAVSAGGSAPQGDRPRIDPAENREPRSSSAPASGSAPARTGTPSGSVAPRETVRPGWVREADYRRNPKPPYPDRARQFGLQGSVTLLVDVTSNGRAERVSIWESSGHDSLDDAAMATVRKWEFQPAARNGLPVPTRVLVPIVFRLNAASR